MRTELAIIGAGPAGMAAAEVAVDCGIDVMVIDEQPAPGGQIYRQPPGEFDVRDWLEGRGYEKGKALLRRVTGDDRIRWLAGSTVVAILPADRVGAERATTDRPAADRQPGESGEPRAAGNARFVLAVDGSGSTRRLEACAVLIAPGCYDMPVLFPGWNLPGVMAAGGIQAFVKSQRFVPGDRFLFVGSHPLQLVVADQVVQGGGEVAGVYFAQEQRRALGLLKSPSVLWHGRDKLLQTAGILRRLRRAGVPVRFGHALLRAHGEERLESVTVAPADRDGVARTGGGEDIACDRLGVCFGFLASSELARQVGAACRWDAPRGGWLARHDGWMRSTVDGVYVAGEITGVAGAEVAAEEGRLAAIGCALDLGRIDEKRASELDRAPRRAMLELDRFAGLLGELSWPGDVCLDQWLAQEDINLCKCEEVTVGVFADALRQNPDVTTANAAKLLTRAGMGPCQGRYCQFAVTRLVSQLTGEPESAVGGYTSRFPSKPLNISNLVDSDL